MGDRGGCFVVTVVLQAEVAMLFIGAGAHRHRILRHAVSPPAAGDHRVLALPPLRGSAPRRRGRVHPRQAVAVLPEGGLR